jgi:outer membrane murein-binding lipoprotein Lpp
MATEDNTHPDTAGFDRLAQKWDTEDAAKKAAAKTKRRARHRSEEYQSSHKPKQWPS